MIQFYCGLNERAWNHHPVAPGPLACVSPVYGKKCRRNNSVSVPAGVQVIQDSGAFSDGPKQRLTFAAALDRQIMHAKQYGYTAQITHRASYDCLNGVDENWQGDVRRKKRGTDKTAWTSVELTIEAAHYIVKHRNGLGLILSAQGVSSEQYLGCVKAIVPLLDTERDMLGMGGFCITGMMPKRMMPVFCKTASLVVPYAAKHGVKRIHIWGVLHAPALAVLLHLCDQHKIALSTDNSGPSTRPCFGNWGYADWTNLDYQQPPVEIRGLERACHVEAVRDWLSGFRFTQYYKEVAMPTLDAKPIQLPLFELAA